MDIKELKDQYKDLLIIRTVKEANNLVPGLWAQSLLVKMHILVPVATAAQFWSVFWEYDKLEVCRECETPATSYGSHGECLECGLILKGWENYRTYIKKYNGPKPGCTAHFLPKRVQFDPPKEMSAWKEGSSWYVKCGMCEGLGKYDFRSPYSTWLDEIDVPCRDCKGTGKKKLSGPSFASAVLIFDRRGV